MKTFWNTQGGLAQLTEWQPNCWIQVTCPTEEDQRELEEKFNIPDYFMSGDTLKNTIYYCATWYHPQT